MQDYYKKWKTMIRTLSKSITFLFKCVESNSSISIDIDQTKGRNSVTRLQDQNLEKVLLCQTLFSP